MLQEQCIMLSVEATAYCSVVWGKRCNVVDLFVVLPNSEPTQFTFQCSFENVQKLVLLHSLEA